MHTYIHTYIHILFILQTRVCENENLQRAVRYAMGTAGTVTVTDTVTVYIHTMANEKMLRCLF